MSVKFSVKNTTMHWEKKHQNVDENCTNSVVRSLLSTVAACS